MGEEFHQLAQEEAVVEVHELLAGRIGGADGAVPAEAERAGAGGRGAEVPASGTATPRLPPLSTSI